MIYDVWKNRDMYAKIHPLFAEGFAYIAQCLEKMPQPGVYEINGKDLFAKVLEYETRQQGDYETHDQYIDIQYLVEGTENVYIAKRSDLQPKGEYDAAEDVQFYQDDALQSSFVFEAGSFVIFYSEEAHKPSMMIETPENALKVVLKVKV